MQDNSAVNKAFSVQSAHYDEDDKANPVIVDLRQQVYRHVERFMKDNCRMLELNSGTGIDATYFTSKGHSVLATDLSDGMISELKRKKIETRQLSYENVNQINEQFDYIFSNFGGLNCIDDLGKVTKHLPALLKPRGYVTWVIMPPICLWEIASLTFRRFHREGVMAHIDGQYFRTWYHSLGEIRKAFGDQFEFIESEGLAALSPPPYKTDFFAYKLSRKIDGALNRTFPFNRWADHIIVTFRKA